MGCLYNNYRSVLESGGGSQYKIAHNNGRKRARETGSSVDLEINKLKLYILSKPTWLPKPNMCTSSPQMFPDVQERVEFMRQQLKVL